MTTPSAAFPFESRYLELDGLALPSGARLPRLRLHYVEAGAGAPILFLHGNPTCAYLWRNVLPAAARHGRAIAIDLMGHGLSDKPDVAYDYEDHFHVLCRAIEALGLVDLTLVLHDWGGFLGFDYAVRHRDNVTGIAAMETFAWRMQWRDLPPLGRLVFRAFRAPGVGEFLLQRLNLFVRAVLPAAVADRRALSREALARYRSFYPTYASRRSIRRWPQLVPLDPQTPTFARAGELEQRLASLDVPVLWLVPQPGLIVPAERISWLRETLPRIELRPVGRGAHFIQEEIPEAIAAELDRWLGGRRSPSGAAAGVPPARRRTREHL